MKSFLCKSRQFAKFILVAFGIVTSGSIHAEESSYELTKQYGSVLFKVLQEEYLYLVGRFDDYSGALTFDPENLSSSSLEATVQMTSLNMADSSVVELLTSSSVWFNTSLYSEATFSTDSVEVTGDNSVDFYGQLTFVGISKPWVISATFLGGSDGELSGDTIGMIAQGSFLRSDFGLDQYMNVAADEIKIQINVKFNDD